MDAASVEALLELARAVVGTGAIGGNSHGNISLLAPGTDDLYYTGGQSLRDHPAGLVVRLGLDGTLREGTLPPIQRAVVEMHTSMYRSPGITCVIHTHAPGATAFAVAQRPLEPWIEAMAMFGMADGVPVAGYAPRGSVEAVANIHAALLPGTPAVLLANHGLLVFHRAPELALMVLGVVEEAAQAALAATAIGGPTALPREMRAAALQRHALLVQEGTARADG
ncbi:MAG: class II aldolase/adducin family protein [Chloroflexota bacterium]